ncbi:MAG: hypothetical protein ACM3SY_11955 [Candidatus Omnitrophota bacterium]
MNNKTLTLNVVKINVPPAPLEGYRVVVFEERQGGKAFKAVLNPGDSPVKPKLSFFSSSVNYCCCAVNADCRLNFDFSESMKMGKQIKSFSINGTVYFYVSNPERMAITYETDPVTRIELEIKKRLQQNILERKIEFDSIQSQFHDIKDRILPDNTLNRLRLFSEEFGITIKEITLTHTIPEKYLAPDRKIEDYYLRKEAEFVDEAEKRKGQENEKDDQIFKHELDEMKTRHEQKKKNIESFNAFQRKIPELLIDGVVKGMENINGPNSLENMAETTMRIIKNTVNPIQNPDQLSAVNSAPTFAPKPKIIAPESTGFFEDAKSFLISLLSKIDDGSFEPEEKRNISSCITHLVGEIYLEKKADPKIIEKHFKELIDFTANHRRIFTRSIMEQLAAIRDDLVDQISNKKL